MKIALISPTSEEGRLLSRYLKSCGRDPFVLYRGKIRKNLILLIISGIGKTNAAMAATYMIKRFSPDLLILFGIGGAYPSASLSIGDVALAEKEFYGDEGVITREGFHGLETIEIPLVNRGKRRFFNEFHLNKRLVSEVKKTVKYPFRSGNFVTLSTVTGTTDRAIELRDRYNAICENMEGAAVAHVCEVFGMDLIEIRGISNIVADRDRSRWDVKAGIRACSNALFEFLKNLS